MNRRFETLKRDTGIGDIGRGEGRVVYLLWKRGPMRQGELAMAADVDKSTLALTLRRMEDKGFVSRESLRGDRRSVLVRLGPRMTERAAAFDVVSERMNALFYRGFDEQAIKDFEEALEKVLENLEADVDGPDAGE